MSDGDFFGVGDVGEEEVEVEEAQVVSGVDVEAAVLSFMCGGDEGFDGLLWVGGVE